MANLKISQLTSLGSAAATDLLPIVDISENKTKNVTVAELIKSISFSTFGEFTTYDAVNTPAIGTIASVGGYRWRYIGSGTAISALPGWVPEGDAYADHWQENTYAGVTNMYAGIMEAAAWCAAQKRPLYFKGYAQYRVDQTLDLTFGDVDWVTDGVFNSSAYIVSFAAAGDPVVRFGPATATTPATSFMTGYSFRNILAYHAQAGSTSASWHGRKANGVYFESCAAWGSKYGWLMEGCTNCHYYRPITVSANFTGASGSAHIKIDSLVQTDTTRFKGFTHQIYNVRDGNDVYDCVVEIADNDYTAISDSYIGMGSLVKIKPSSNTAVIVNVELNNVYTDGAVFPNSSTCIEIDGVSYAGTQIDFIHMNGGILGQANYGLYIHDAPTLGTVAINNCDMHWFVKNAIKVVSCPNLVLTVNGGNINFWAGSGTPTGDDEYAIVASNIKALNCLGLTAQSPTTARPFAKVTTYNTLNFSNNTLVGIDENITYDASGTYIVNKNQSNIVWYDTDSRKSGSWTPVINFGGAAVGQAWTSRLANWWRLEGNVIAFSVYIALDGAGAGKGSSTGAATIPLPFTALTNRSYSCAITINGISTVAGTVGFAASIDSGASSIRLSRLTTSLNNLTDTDLTAYGLINVTGFYERA